MEGSIVKTEMVAGSFLFTDAILLHLAVEGR